MNSSASIYSHRDVRTPARPVPIPANKSTEALDGPVSGLLDLVM